MNFETNLTIPSDPRTLRIQAYIWYIQPSMYENAALY